MTFSAAVGWKLGKCEKNTHAYFLEFNFVVFWRSEFWRISEVFTSLRQVWRSEFWRSRSSPKSDPTSGDKFGVPSFLPPLLLPFPQAIGTCAYPWPGLAKFFVQKCQTVFFFFFCCPKAQAWVTFPSTKPSVKHAHLCHCHIWPQHAEFINEAITWGFLSHAFPFLASFGELFAGLHPCLHGLVIFCWAKRSFSCRHCCTVQNSWKTPATQRCRHLS